MRTRLRSGANLLCVLLLATAAVLLAACGGSSSSPRAASAQSSRDAANAAGSTAGVTTNRDVVTTGTTVHRPLHGTGGDEINDDNPGHADTGHDQPGSGDPCALVSRAEAQAISGRPMSTPIDAPLGPTCIYQPRDAANFITLTVASKSFATISRTIRNPRRVDLGGHTAYCGTYGQPTTFVPLSRGRVLTVTAPCAIGIRFAARAVPRLKS
jgi:hypothetical protein